MKQPEIKKKTEKRKRNLFDNDDDDDDDDDNNTEEPIWDADELEAKGNVAGKVLYS